MGIVGEELKKETEYLELVKKRVIERKAKVGKENEKIWQSITETQKETFKDTSGMDIAEIEFATSEMERQYLQAKLYYQTIQKLEKVLQTPYFERIDFCNKQQNNKIYRFIFCK